MFSELPAAINLSVLLINYWHIQYHSPFMALETFLSLSRICNYLRWHDRNTRAHPFSDEVNSLFINSLFDKMVTMPGSVLPSYAHRRSFLYSSVIIFFPYPQFFFCGPILIISHFPYLLNQFNSSLINCSNLGGLRIIAALMQEKNSTFYIWHIVSKIVFKDKLSLQTGKAVEDWVVNCLQSFQKWRLSEIFHVYWWSCIFL